jgi:hypothetical protein
VQRLFCWNWKFAALCGDFQKVATSESMSAFHPADRHGKLGEYQNFGTVIGIQYFHILESYHYSMIYNDLILSN